MIRRTDEPRRFRSEMRPGEVLAIEPQAIDFSYLYTDVMPTDYTEEGIAIVTINGPLEHHATTEWDSYESIVARVEAAMSGEEVSKLFELSGEDVPPPVKAQAVILKIDSPGGEASGSSACHRTLRRLRKKYNVPLYAYADEMAASAAYSVASACDEIWLPDTGQVGSIGVVATMYDRTKHNEKTGLTIELLTSGEQKADNHADRVLTDAIRKRMRVRVMALARVFFSTVAKARGTSPAAIASLQAGVFTGQTAVDVGIADGVCSWTQFLAYVASSINNGQDVAKKSKD